MGLSGFPELPNFPNSLISRKIGTRKAPHNYRGGFWFSAEDSRICEIFRRFCHIGSLSKSSISAPDIVYPDRFCRMYNILHMVAFRGEFGTHQNRSGRVEVFLISRIPRKIGPRMDPDTLPSVGILVFGYGLIGICEILRRFCQIGSLAQSSLSDPHIMGG